ncbi:MAG: acyltransferase family protein [Desulfobacteraceae bacterium]|jgi:peptidoglycan/LPS O-acetylase OafA/YrhL
MDDSSVSSPLANIGRIHYLDQVRALAMMVGIFIHACFPYAYGFQENWTIRDDTSSLAITLGFYFLHLFRMPVFFLIAGFFANYLYQKRGVKGFLKHRVKRIGLPFIIFLPLLLIGVTITQLFSLYYVPEEKMTKNMQQALVQVKEQIQQARAQNSGIPIPAAEDGTTTGLTESEDAFPENNTSSNVMTEQKPLTSDGTAEADAANNPEERGQDPVITLHLWFLYYLLMFCACAALLQKFNNRFITRIFSTFFSSPIYVWLLPLVIFPALYSVGVPADTPGHILPRFWAFGYYGVFFLMGWHFFYHQDYPDKFKKHLGIMILLSIIALVIYLYMVPVAESFRNTIASDAALKNMRAYSGQQKIYLVTLEAFLSIFLTMITLILGKRYLNFPNKVMRFISDSSYLIYLIHWPLVTFIQIFFVTMPFSGYFKFIISSAILLGIGLVTYRYMVRYTPIGTMLNGKKVRVLA